MKSNVVALRPSTVAVRPLTRAEIAQLTAADLLVELARRGVKEPTNGAILRQRTTCPHCKHEGPVEKDFGIRVLRGEVVPQSWCRDCRSASSVKQPKKVIKKSARRTH